MSTTTRFLARCAVVLLMLSAGALPAEAAGLTTDQMNALLGLLRAFNADEATITNVQNILNGQGGSGFCHNFSFNLQRGMTGAEVTALQTALTKDGETVPQIGIYGPLTARAVSAFQVKYASEVLYPTGLYRGTGMAGPATRAKLNALFGCKSSGSSTITYYGGGGGGSSHRSSSGSSNPAPSCRLSANAPSVQTGHSPTLNWTSQDATSISIDNGLGFMQMVASGSVNTSPLSATTTFTATVNGLGGTGTCSVTVGISNPVVVNDFDYNSDHVVNNTDLSLLSGYVVSGQACPTAKQCDVNHDGVRDVVDVVSLTYIVKGLTSGSFDLNNDGKVDSTDTTLYRQQVPAPNALAILVFASFVSQADYNNSGAVDSADVTFLTDLILTGGACPTNKVCDLTKDGKTDVNDVVTLIKDI